MEITSTDNDQVGDVIRDKRIDQKVGIYSYGCQYPSVRIEGPPKSKKLILSATENVVCESNPGYDFRWKAKLVSFDSSLDVGNTTLEQYFSGQYIKN